MRSCPDCSAIQFQAPGIYCVYFTPTRSSDLVRLTVNKDDDGDGGRASSRGDAARRRLARRWPATRGEADGVLPAAGPVGPSAAVPAASRRARGGRGLAPAPRDAGPARDARRTVQAGHSGAFPLVKGAQRVGGRPQIGVGGAGERGAPGATAAGALLSCHGSS